MKNSGPLEDRILIRELYGRYADAACSGDGTLVVGLALHAVDTLLQLFPRAQLSRMREAQNCPGFVCCSAPGFDKPALCQPVLLYRVGG